MAKGISIHIGLNAIDQTHYGTLGLLHGCENDAYSMQSIAAVLGYKSTVILTRDATADRLLTELKKASKILTSGDTLFLTYSGHGSQIKDETGEEDDGYDETWCLYDRMLIDDEIYQAWSYFEQGVRIVVLSDSCHSGTVIKNLFLRAASINIYPDEVLYRGLPITITEPVARKFSYLYQNIKKNIPENIKSEIKCTVLLISGCQDNQLSQDGPQNGLFTDTLMKVWDNGAFAGNYLAFQQKIRSLMPPSQTPNYLFIGANNPDFENLRPFNITKRFRYKSNGNLSNENGQNKISYKIDLDEKIFDRLSDVEIREYISKNVVDSMVESYKQFKSTTGQLFSRTKGGEVHADVHCDTHTGGCDIHVGGNIRF